MSPTELKRIGRYEILETIGQGPTGTVYKAARADLPTTLAVKILSAGPVARLLREARAAAELTHRGAIRIHHAGSEGDLPAIVMEFAEGGSLAALLARGPLEPREALRIAAEAADALQAGHDRGIVHRNLKPSNILLDAARRPKLADFGLALLPEEEERPMSASPGHRSPEQIFASPDEVDPRADVYSLGSLLYEMLTGRPPFDGPDPVALLKRIELEDPAAPSARRPGLSKKIDAVVFRALAKEPSGRFATAKNFALALRAALPPTRTRALAAAGVLAAVALVLAFRATRPAPPRLPEPARGPIERGEDLYPVVRDLAVKLGDLAADPARVSGEIFERVGPLLERKPASAASFALVGVAHLVQGNRRLAEEFFAEARARQGAGDEPRLDPVAALLAAATEEEFRQECGRFLARYRLASAEIAPGETHGAK